MRQRVLRLFVRCGLASREMVAVMQGWGHSGDFSVHADVRIASHGLAGRERLLRYCARPLFAGEQLVRVTGGEDMRYRLAWPALLVRHSGLQRSIELRLSASEFLDRIAGLIPQCANIGIATFGVLAPNPPWRALVAAQAGRKLAAGSTVPRPKTERAVVDCGQAGNPACYLLAQLLARS